MQIQDCASSCLLCILIVFSSFCVYLLLFEWQKDETFNCTLEATSLEDVVRCVVDKMPQAFHPLPLKQPTEFDMLDWRKLVHELAQGNWMQKQECPKILASSFLYRYYAIVEFDKYCILLEKSQRNKQYSALGWGTLIVKRGPRHSNSSNSGESVTGEQMKNGDATGEQVENGHVTGELMENGDAIGEQVKKEHVTDEQVKSDHATGELMKSEQAISEQVKNGQPIGELVKNGRATVTDDVDLILQVPHPITDGNVVLQAVSVLQLSRAAQMLLISGTTRNASDSASTCIPGTYLTDVAHNTGNLFHAATVQLFHSYRTRNAQMLALQLHGMAESSCPGVDVFLSSGIAAPATLVEPSTLQRFKQLLRVAAPQWNITSPGEEPACNLAGTTNVQGRFLNLAFRNDTVANVCTHRASEVSDLFVHMEQKRAVRDSSQKSVVQALDSLLLTSKS